MRRKRNPAVASVLSRHGISSRSSFSKTPEAPKKELLEAQAPGGETFFSPGAVAPAEQQVTRKHKGYYLTSE